MKYIVQGWVWLLLMALGGCQKALDPGITTPAGKDLFRLRLLFAPVAGGQPLRFNASTYTNAFNEPYTVSTFKFYISQVDLINSDSNLVYRVDRNLYFLVDEADTAKASIQVSAAAHRYNQLAFVVGVDSARNVSGAQTGALDPANGMFWTWNSGYIMAKLEGTSPLSGQPGNRIEYHIGGFRQPDNTLRRIVLTLPAVPAAAFRAGATASITLHADVNAWFQNPHELRIARTPVWMTPGDTSRMISENYAHMFSVINVAGN